MSDEQPDFSAEAVGAFRERFATDEAFRHLPLTEPRFRQDVGDVGFLVSMPGVAVEVSAARDRTEIRTGMQTEESRAEVDATTAGLILGIDAATGERLMAHTERSLRAGVAAWDAALADYREQMSKFVPNMTALDDALRRIEKKYNQVFLSEEDPETFGAGHYVFYPLGHTRSRLAIEERYTGTDWSDPDRVPTSWTWRAERSVRRADGRSRWVTDHEGETPSDRYAELIDRAEAWARRTNFIETRIESFRHSVIEERNERLVRNVWEQSRRPPQL